MAGNQPFRHGHRHSSMPSRIVPGQAGNQVVVRQTPMPQGPGQGLPQLQRPILVDQKHAWLNSLPHETIQQLQINAEVQFPAAAIAGDTFKIAVFQVDEQQVWVLTDVTYYAFGPPDGLSGKPTLIQPHELVGLVNFSTLFGGSTRMRELNRRVSPYAPPGTAPQTFSGWGWLNTPFGVQRMPAFAIYAHGLEEVTIVGQIEDPPQFPVTKVGALLSGFAMPSGLFNEIWRPG